MEIKKEVTIELDKLTAERKFVGKGLYACKTGNIVDIYRRQWIVNPKKTLALLVVNSVIIGILIGALLWY